jgi:hypothetical protein
MRNKLGPVEKFYIDNHPNTSSIDLAKMIGSTVKNIDAYRKPGLNREGNPKGEPEKGITSSPERANELIQQSQKAAEQQPAGSLPSIQGRPVPSMRIDALIARHGGTTSLTGPAAELADMFDGISPDDKGQLKGPAIAKYDPFNDPTKVHKIK